MLGINETVVFCEFQPLVWEEEYPGQNIRDREEGNIREQPDVLLDGCRVLNDQRPIGDRCLQRTSLIFIYSIPLPPPVWLSCTSKQLFVLALTALTNQRVLPPQF